MLNVIIAMTNIDIQSVSQCSRRIFSTYLNCFRLALSILTVFQDGGNNPEVVFREISQCCGRDFSMDYDCLRVAQLTLAVGNTSDRSVRPLQVCCRHRGKHWE